ncbi:hypothetical protein CcaverHIS002_0700940 [Cutaneotrichosporon cavernicola]|nr:hypothetical protein CcaverHIS002_0700940 [Cutaneotrichosporon cavernicola]
MSALILRALSALLATCAWPSRRRPSPPLPDSHTDNHTDNHTDPLLDSNAFPHLLDAIIAASEPYELMAFRQVSKGARSCADAVLFAHVAIVALNNYPLVEYWAPDMRTRLPLQPRMDAECIDHSAKLTHTRALDIYFDGRCFSGYSARVFRRYQWCEGPPWPAATLLKNPDIVRRADASMPHPPTTILVDYIDLTAPLSTGMEFIHATGECTDYVLHLSFAQHSNVEPTSLRLRGAKRSHNIRNITLILSPQGEAYGDYSRRKGWVDRFDVLLPLMQTLVPWLAGGARLTIVGAEQCHPIYIGLMAGTTLYPGRQPLHDRTIRCLSGISEMGEGIAIPPVWQGALRSRVYEIPVADAEFGSSADENWHWNRNEVDRAHEVAETMLFVTFDEWRAEQDGVVAQWRPAKSV